MIQQICECTGYTYQQLKPKSRVKEVCFGRQLVMVELMNRNVTETAASGFFNLHHSTANHAKKVVRIVEETRYPIWMYNMMRMFKYNTESLALVPTEETKENFNPFIYESLTH